ncbi:MAG: calcium/sodium antiporter [Candidatus Altiarchaeota archaeon]
MILSIAAFLAGLILLVKGSDFLVESATRIAHYLGVSDLVIGLTLVAVGTSLPELGSSIAAVLKGNPGIATGNIVGSNIANIGLILGLTASLRGLSIRPEMFKRDGIIMVGITVLFLVFALDGTINTVEGMMLLLMFSAYTLFLFEYKPRFERFYRFKKYFGEYFKFKNLSHRMRIIDRISDRIPDDLIRGVLNPRTYHRVTMRVLRNVKEGIVRELCIMMIGSLAVLIGADYLVNGAVEIANYFGVPDVIIGLTIVAMGTSLPELMVSLSSVKKGYDNLLVGNLIGSNIGNMTLIGGLSAVLAGLPIDNLTMRYTLPAMLAFAVVCVVFLRSGERVTRVEGALLLVGYAVFMGSVLSA